VVFNVTKKSEQFIKFHGLYYLYLLTFELVLFQLINASTK